MCASKLHFEIVEYIVKFMESNLSLISHIYINRERERYSLFFVVVVWGLFGQPSVGNTNLENAPTQKSVQHIGFSLCVTSSLIRGDSDYDVYPGLCQFKMMLNFEMLHTNLKFQVGQHAIAGWSARDFIWNIMGPFPPLSSQLLVRSWYQV